LTALEPELALPTYNIVRVLLLLFSMVIAYPYIPGSDSPAFKALSVFVGVLFSLGSSSLIGNIIAGYSMTFRKAFRPGDRIMVDGQVGYVEEQKTMTTRIRTVKNEEIVMPNSVLINSSIINYSTKARQDGVILHSSVRVGYETPWRLVDAMLLTAADRTKDILKDRPPFVLKKALDDAAIEYEINVYCVDPMKINRIYNELHGHILDIFNENAVQIMRPSYEGDPDSPKVVPKEEWHRPLRVDDPDEALKEEGYRKNMEDAVRSSGGAGK
jgi:small-conductance mechanosensitive channel